MRERNRLAVGLRSLRCGVSRVDLRLDMTKAAGYRNGTQIARVITQDWVSRQVGCLSCGSGTLRSARQNAPALDFTCSSCQAPFELKSKQAPFGGKLVDGQYDKLVSALRSDSAPNFLLLRYDLDRAVVVDLFAIRHELMTPMLVEKRTPLSPFALRKFWVGCNINLDGLPPGALIPWVRNGFERPLEAARWDWARFDKLAVVASENRGWLIDVLSCIQRIPGGAFTLSEVYRFESELQGAHPRNKNVRPKIRQQLQILVQQGFVNRVRPGLYIRAQP